MALLHARTNHPPLLTTTLMMITGRKKRSRLMMRVVVGLERSKREIEGLGSADALPSISYIKLNIFKMFYYRKTYALICN